MAAGASTTEYVVKIIRLLREQPGRAGLTLSEIEASTGWSGVYGNTALTQSLQSNEKVFYDRASERYSYRAKYACDDLHGLLRILKNHESGLHLKDVEDAFPGAAAALLRLARTGGMEELFAATMGAGAATAGRGTTVAPVSRQALVSSQAAGIVRLRNDDRAAGDMLLRRDPLVR